MKWIYLLIAISAEVAATTALKASQGFTKLAPYALWSGVGIVFISLIGWRFFDQSLDTPAMIGIALIIAGVAVINLLSKSTPH